MRTACAFPIIKFRLFIGTAVTIHGGVLLNKAQSGGWFFSVGDETDEYVNDPGNLELWVVNSALIYDPALTEFITAPYGTTIVRVSSDRFEPDEPGKEIFIVKN